MGRDLDTFPNKNYSYSHKFSMKMLEILREI